MASSPQMSNFQKPFNCQVLKIVMLSFMTLSSLEARSDIDVICHSDQAELFQSQDIYNLYLGLAKRRGLTLLNQAEGQTARREFFLYFLKLTEIEVRKKWSILVFSGNRTPSTLKDDFSVLEYVENNESAIGYVNSKVIEALPPNPEKPRQFKILFKIKAESK